MTNTNNNNNESSLFYARAGRLVRGTACALSGILIAISTVGSIGEAYEPTTVAATLVTELTSTNTGQSRNALQHVQKFTEKVGKNLSLATIDIKESSEAANLARVQTIEAPVANLVKPVAIKPAAVDFEKLEAENRDVPGLVRVQLKTFGNGQKRATNKQFVHDRYSRPETSDVLSLKHRANFYAKVLHEEAGVSGRVPVASAPDEIKTIQFPIDGIAAIKVSIDSVKERLKNTSGGATSDSRLGPEMSTLLNTMFKDLKVKLSSNSVTKDQVLERIKVAVLNKTNTMMNHVSIDAGEATVNIKFDDVGCCANLSCLGSIIQDEVATILKDTNIGTLGVAEKLHKDLHGEALENPGTCASSKVGVPTVNNKVICTDAINRAAHATTVETLNKVAQGIVAQDTNVLSAAIKPLTLKVGVKNLDGLIDDIASTVVKSDDFREKLVANLLSPLEQGALDIINLKDTNTFVLATDALRSNGLGLNQALKSFALVDDKMKFGLETAPAPANENQNTWFNFGQSAKQNALILSTKEDASAEDVANSLKQMYPTNSVGYDLMHGLGTITNNLSAPSRAVLVGGGLGTGRVASAVKGALGASTTALLFSQAYKDFSQAFSNELQFKPGQYSLDVPEEKYEHKAEFEESAEQIVAVPEVEPGRITRFGRYVKKTVTPKRVLLTSLTTFAVSALAFAGVAYGASIGNMTCRQLLKSLGLTKMAGSVFPF